MLYLQIKCDRCCKSFHHIILTFPLFVQGMWHRFKPIWYEGIYLISFVVTILGWSLDRIFLDLIDVDTINTLMWSNGLDETFSENVKRDPTIYQYFASKEGMLRYFPAHRYRTAAFRRHTNVKLK